MSIYPSQVSHTYSRAFSTSFSCAQTPSPDHYAALDLNSQASGKEIKLQFYQLSKKHHPDRTRSLPENEASDHRKKFEEISEAYSVLGDPKKKKTYDRERASLAGSGLHGGDSGKAGGGGGQGAQYSRGGRPASGLSRRRNTFRGPPPSFYKSGAWGSGDNAARRGEAAEQTGQRQRGQADANANASQSTGGAGSSSTTNRFETQSPWPFTTDANDVPHFDRAGHYRTTSNIEEQLRQGRRKRRAVLMRAREEAMARGSGRGFDAIFSEDIGPAKEMRSFFTVVGIVLLGCGGGWILFRTQ